METNEGELLRKYLRDQKITQEEFAEKLDLTRQGLGVHFRKEKLSHSFKLQLKDLGVTIFDKGKDNFTNGSGSANNTTTLIVSKTDHGKNKEPANSEGIPIYEVSATAGEMENVSQMPDLPSFHVKVPGYEDCNFGMHVYGHSMYPTIETGSLILCRKVKNKSVIMYGEIYLIRTDDYLMVKRLQKNSQTGHVLCTSDNFEKRSEDYRRFEPFEISIDSIIDLYLVKGIIKKTQS